MNLEKLAGHEAELIDTYIQFHNLLDTYEERQRMTSEIPYWMEAVIHHYVQFNANLSIKSVKDIKYTLYL